MIYINLKQIFASVFTAGLLFSIGAGITNAKAYTVKSGDTLSQISADHNISLNQLLALNSQVGLNSIIYPGDHLKVTSSNNSNGQTQVATQTVTAASNNSQTVASQPVNNGSTYQQFIAAGGTQAMWNSIVIPESGGDVNAANGQYHGLFQAQYAWGYGSAYNQTKGAIQYADERYGSVSNAVAYRQANGSW